MDNRDFRLSDEQLAALHRWSRRIVRTAWTPETAESFSVAVAFKFTARGRSIQARIGTETLLLEVMGESTYPVPRERS